MLVPEKSVEENETAGGSSHKKRMRQTILCHSNGKLMAKLPPHKISSDLKEAYTVKVENHLPVWFASKTEGAPSTDVPGFNLPPQVFDGWNFYLTVEWLGWTNATALAGVEYLIKLHGGQIINEVENIDMHTVVVECDRFELGVSWKNGRRVYTQFVIFEHIERQQTMTRRTLDNVLLRDAGENEAADEDMDVIPNHDLDVASDEGMGED